MYYKRSTGAILVRKSVDSPNWIKWTHHSEGKSHCDECLKLDGCFFSLATPPILSLYIRSSGIRSRPNKRIREL